MHIAVCDDNIADRKQLERLLGRESDKRKEDTGVFYTDSFGDSDALSKNPMPYDLFFIDLTACETDGLSFALKLRQMGVTAPIVLCSSKIDYLTAMESLPNSSTDFMHLNKPILTSELSAALDQAILLQKNRIPTIELRSDKDTYYVKEDDIVYAVTEGQFVNVYLKDGTMVPIITKMTNFYYGVAMFPHMFLLSEKSMINIAYLDKISPFKITLKDGTKLKSSPLNEKYLKNALQEYHAEQI